MKYPVNSNANDPKNQPNHYFDRYELGKFNDLLQLIANRHIYSNLKSILNSNYKDFLMEFSSDIASADGYTEQWGGIKWTEIENTFKDIECNKIDLKNHDFVLNYVYPALETLRKHKVFVFEPWEDAPRVTSEYFIKPEQPNQILVFGSNLAGKHGKGLAKEALKFGAVLGIGEGLQSQTYALPTKDEKIKTLSLNEIAKHIETFKQFAQEHPELEFLVTKIGCGLAGYHPIQIRPLFGWHNPKIHKNIILPLEFIT